MEDTPPLEHGSRADRIARGVLFWAVWGYLAAIVVLAIVLCWTADYWWVGTVVAFSPRWAVAWPLGILTPFAAFWRRKLLWPIGATAAIIVGPVLGFELSFPSSVDEGALEIRVLTCNLDQTHADVRRVPLLITRYASDVVLLQECPPDTTIDWPDGWSSLRAGNLVIASRFPLGKLTSLQNRHPPSRWPPVDGLLCPVETPGGRIVLCNVHLRSPREGLKSVADRYFGVNPSRSADVDREIELRDAEAADLRQAINAVDGPLIVAGDFNMPCESAIYREHWGDLANCFSQRGFGFGYTKSTWIGAMEYGTRIDHVLASSHWRVQSCEVGPDIGSDHNPLVAELSLPAD